MQQKSRKRYWMCGFRWLIRFLSCHTNRLFWKTFYTFIFFLVTRCFLHTLNDVKSLNNIQKEYQHLIHVLWPKFRLCSLQQYDEYASIIQVLALKYITTLVFKQRYQKCFKSSFCGINFYGSSWFHYCNEEGKQCYANVQE